MSRKSVIQLSHGSGAGPSFHAFSVSCATQTIGAALAAESVLWAWSFENSQDIPTFFIERLRLQWTTITPFTVPVTRRRLALVKLSEMPTGAGNFNSSITNKQFSVPNQPSGSPPVLKTAATGALTYGGSIPVSYFAQLNLTGFGNAGATVDKEWKWNGDDTAPFKVDSSTILGIINPEVMDAAGTFQLTVEMDVQGYP